MTNTNNDWAPLDDPAIFTSQLETIETQFLPSTNRNLSVLNSAEDELNKINTILIRNLHQKINTIESDTTTNSIVDQCLNELRITDGLLDASIIDLYQTIQNISNIDTYYNLNDVCGAILLLQTKDSEHDASLISLFTKDSEHDASLSTLVTDISQINAIIYDISSDYYSFIVGNKQATSISAETINVTTIDVSSLFINGELITSLGGGSSQITDISNQVATLTTHFNTFEDYFTQKPYLLLAPSYEEPMPSNNNTIRLSWSIPNPQPKKAALNFIGSSHDIGGTDLNLENIDSGVQSLLTAAKVNLTNYNYLPYFDSVNIDYRKKSNQATWVTLSTNDLRLNGANNASPELYPHTEITKIKLGTADPTGTYDYSNNILIYNNENLFPIDSEEYQFRIYLKNQNDDPIESYTDSHGIINPTWYYLYIPTNSGDWISLPSRGAASAPLLIQLTLQTGSDKYRMLNITGANNNPNSTNPEAEVGLNTLFTDLEDNSLHVNYGFDLSGSRSSTSKQAIPVDSNYINISQSYQSNDLYMNSWNIDNNAHFPLAPGVDPMDTENSIIFPGYTYELSGYFMKIDTDDNWNVYTTQYPSPTPYPAVTIQDPTRNNITSGTSNYDNFVSSGTSFSNTYSGSGYIVSTAYPNDEDMPISDIHFIDPANSFQLSSNTTYKIKNTINSNDTLYGTDLSGQDLCYFKFSTSAPIPSDITGDMRKGFIGNDSLQTVTNNYFEFTQSETKDAANLNSTASEIYRRQGWFLGVDIYNLKVKDIKLANYPDICNNSYNPYTINFQQFNPSNIQLGSQSYDLKIAQKPTLDITLINYNIVHNLLSNMTFKDFFGLKHIYNEIIISVTGEFINLNKDWRNFTNLLSSNLKLKIDTTDTNQNITSIPWTRNVTNVSFSGTTNINTSIYTSTKTYSRASTVFSIKEGKHYNNVTRGNPITIEDRDISFGQDLLWDYTWGLTGSNRKTLPNSNWRSNLTLMKIGTTLYPDFLTEISGQAFNQSDILSDNELMWCDDAYRSGEYSPSNKNPYINYNTYYNNMQDYSVKNSSGTNVSANDIDHDPATYNLMPDVNANTAAGTYKWIIIKDLHPSTIANASINIQNTNNVSLTLGQDYLLYILEDGVIGPGIIRSEWKSAQLKFIIQDLLDNNKNGAGAYIDGVSVSYPIKLFSTSCNIYYRIGLKNGAHKAINKITITYGTS